MDPRVQSAIDEGLRLRDELNFCRKQEAREKKLSKYKKWIPLAQKWINEELFTSISKAIEQGHNNFSIKLKEPIDIARDLTPYDVEALYECIAILASEIEGISVTPGAYPDMHHHMMYGGLGSRYVIEYYTFTWSEK